LTQWSGVVEGGGTLVGLEEVGLAIGRTRILVHPRLVLNAVWLH
jgi:hypothetical protein